jgi:hypothetical protein
MVMVYMDGIGESLSHFFFGHLFAILLAEQITQQLLFSLAMSAFRRYIGCFVLVLAVSVFSASTLCNIALALTVDTHTEQTDECCSHESEAAHEESAEEDECAPGTDCSHCVCSHITVTQSECIEAAAIVSHQSTLIPHSIGTPLSLPKAIDHPPLW